MRNKTWLGLLLIIGFLSVILIPLMLPSSSNSSQPKAINGVLDLREWDFNQDGPVTLNGEWAFYYDAFYSLKDMHFDSSLQPKFITLPSSRDTFKSDLVKDDYFYGTYHLTVLLPPDDTIYGLSTDIYMSSYRLFIDDKLQTEVGKVGVDASTSEPYYKQTQTYFKPIASQAEIIYQASDFHFGDRAIKSPLLGHADQISDASKFKLSRDLLLFGILFIMGVYHIGLFIKRNKDRTPLYFGIFCLAFAFRMLLVGERFLPTLFDLNFKSFARFTYIAVYLGFSSLCAFLYSSFKSLISPASVSISLGISFVYTLLALLLPFTWLDRLLGLYMVVGFSTLFYMLYRLIIGYYRRVPFTGAVLVGFICLIMVFINDYLYEVTLKNMPSMIPFGLTFFVFLQAYMLSAKSAYAFSQSEMLSIENSEILLELKEMNSRLESEVEKRTADLEKRSEDLETALMEVELLSNTDYLTGLPNRRHMLSQIEKAVVSDAGIHIAVADIDHFKLINDTFGHDVGDQVLIELSKLIADFLGERGIIGRWGGEEFLILLYETDTQNALLLSNQLIELVTSKVFSPVETKVSLTIGMSQYDKKSTIDDCIHSADTALYSGKQAGRCRVVTS
ncbi:MAG: hypothetical protein BGO41_10420 [Clostridiales bacterium 38-18]|nr:MAG: hypothetical protein BGO41_10420 [Clostridiales bacterium 38-18]